MTTHTQKRLCAKAWTLILLLGSSAALQAQEILWDRIGDGVVTIRPWWFKVLGDQDGDGKPEIMLLAEDPQAPPAGYVISSRPGGAILATHVYEDIPSNFGSTGFPQGPGNLHDMDGDGIDEYSLSAVGFRLAGSSLPLGKAYIYSGRTHQIISTLMHGLGVLEFGSPFRRIGDVNGDGFPDYGIGAPIKMFVYSGRDMSFVREHPQAPDYTWVGDINGDGHADYVTAFGAYGIPSGGEFFGQGKIQWFSGVDGAEILTVIGANQHDALGNNVERAGDWDGDGIPDLVASGAWQALGDEYVKVLSSVDGSTIQRFQATNYVSRRAWFGSALASGHDINGDGVPDLVVGAFNHPRPPGLPPFPPNRLRGAVLVFSGATGALLWQTEGEHIAQHFGRRVHLFEDWNGDGFADWAVLSRDYDLTPDDFFNDDFAGRLTIYGGAPGDATPVCHGAVNSTGQSARLWNIGPISVEQNRMELAISNLPPSTLVIIVHGQLTPPNPFGSAELCIGTPLSVLALRVSPPDGGPARAVVDLQAAPFTDGGNVVRAGDRWAFQALYRDSMARNSSNALDVMFVP